MKIRVVVITLSVLFANFVWAENYSPARSSNPKDVFWGDTHLHTRNSADAYTYGNKNLSPDDAYRYAQGKELVAHNGMKVRIKTPLDFLVVADHAEYLGGFYRYGMQDPRIKRTVIGRKWDQWTSAGEDDKIYPTFTASQVDPVSYPPFPERLQKSIWKGVANSADAHNKPGTFTTFSGYEWTSMINRNNLHRVVIYKDSADKVAQMAPFSAQSSQDPRELWKFLAQYEKATDGEVIAIPHNSNLSGGMMFPDNTVDGNPIDVGYARMSARWEPLAEVTQVKGDSETHPILSPDDEFADFETFDTNLGLKKTKENKLKHDYARGALKQGLLYQKKFQVNPYKFGMIGSTDGHNSLSTPEEDNFFGKFVESEPRSERTSSKLAGDRLWENWSISASGYAAVWATENTREALFAAMKRKEVYATTGSRIRVRFFGGWEYTDSMIDKPNYEELGYRYGVPMGGDLINGGLKKSPTFMFSASKDPLGANLDRIQIVKGWLDKRGQLHEKVYNVAWAGARVPDEKTGFLRPIGSTVSEEDATYDNSIGDYHLSGIWTDPDFDEGQRSFYYCRVIEIPRPRWTLKDAVFFDIMLPDEVPKVIQDRAYTSPIWYQPN